MPSKADLARHFGVSRVRITQLCKEGMPTNSYKAAERWKDSRGQKRAATNSTANSHSKKKGRPRNKKPVPRTGDSLYDRLQSTILVQEEAFAMLQEAMRDGDDQQISIRLSVHNKAVEASFKAEETYRAELERRGMLVSWTAAAELFRRGFEVMMNRMRRLPQSMAQRCNPQNPITAHTVLETEVEGIIAAAQREYGDSDSLVPSPRG